MSESSRPSGWVSFLVPIVISLSLGCAPALVAYGVLQGEVRSNGRRIEVLERQVEGHSASINATDRNVVEMRAEVREARKAAEEAREASQSVVSALMSGVVVPASRKGLPR